MLFNSAEFLLFFPVTAVMYFLMPHKWRTYWLLAASYYFYMQWSVIHAFLLLFSTLVTYLSGLLIEKYQGSTGRKNACVAGSFIINLLILFVFKYADMIPGVSLGLIPVVGISFYTFQALSYTADVYRGDIAAEHDFCMYALFVSFFPQLVAGPIEKSKDLLPQFREEHRFDYDTAREGFCFMLWGYFIKLCIADRAAVIVDSVFNNIGDYAGAYSVLAAVLFAFQIYCDFAGYSLIALGCARIMGFRLTENFDAPYLSCTVTDFWRRWHISLTSWFRSYLYFPLGGSRKGRARHLMNIMIVFLVSGLWHGAAIHFVIWGGINGLYQVVENLTGISDKVKRNKVTMVLSGIVTFAVVDAAWVFFRAASTGDAVKLLLSIFKGNKGAGLLNMGLNSRELAVLGVSLAVLMVADIFRRCGKPLRKSFLSAHPVIRAILTAVAASAILLFGIWGAAFEQTAFIYFQF